jgi:tetratricopeptide (TPR) repeat protein
MGNSCIVNTGPKQIGSTGGQTNITFDLGSSSDDEVSNRTPGSEENEEWSLIQHAHKKCREGDSAMRMGDLEKAMSKYRQMLHIPQSLPNNPQAALYIKQLSMASMAKVYMQKENYDDASLLYESSLEISQKIEDKRGEGIILLKLAIIHREQRKYKRGLKECQSALDIFRELGDQTEDEAITLQHQGSILRKLRRNEESQQSYKQARSILRQGHHQQGQAAF